MSYDPPIRGVEYIFYVDLVSRANPYAFQDNPTLAAGDVKVSIDGGAYNNIATLPVATPAGSSSLKVTVSASEMDGDNVRIKFRDAAGNEWNDAAFGIQTRSAIETGIDEIQALRLILAATAGKVSGAVSPPAATTINIRNVGDTKTRIQATVDAAGNRSAVVVDGT